MSPASPASSEAFVCDPHTPEYQTRLFEIYRALRDEHPVYHNPRRGFFLLSRHADVLAALERPTPFRNGMHNHYARGLRLRNYRGVPTVSHGGLWPGYRTEFLRAALQLNDKGQWTVAPAGAQGSGVLRSMSEANCFIVLEHERGNVTAGEMVQVQAMEGLV